MKQLTQNLKSGKMGLLDVPFPALSPGYVLVRNYYSLISSGTEGGKVKTARSSLVKKAKEKPEQFKQVIDSLKSEGFKATYQKVMNKLDAPAPLGYSCAGKVIEVSPEVSDFKVGDFVACGGATAVHGEVVAVPKNLCVRAKQGINIKHAAYTTVASIAVQGIRQADLRIGESCAIIGLGLIGQLCVQLLKASGVKVAGIDIDPVMVDSALKSGADVAFESNNPGLENSIQEFSDGYGVDAVIICAGTSSLDPVELAGRLCRKKGKVVIVGAVPTGFSRHNYYKKELELIMSCSYGPGRYDMNYEEKGLDYPIEFARWTENRNMQAYLDLVSAGKMNIDLLTTHIIPFEEAKSAYDMILSKSECCVGILLKYDTEKQLSSSIRLHNLKRNYKEKKPNIGFIGAGSFAQKFLLPNAQKLGKMIAVAAASGNNARNAADKYSFKYAFGDADKLLDLADVNTIFIATRHNLHAEYVIKSIQKGKNVFVEKPLCMKEKELDIIMEEYYKQNVHLMVGFNRRFSPYTRKILDHLGKDTKKAINYRINIGIIPADHWTQDTDIGGGRIIGEVCHFLDLSMYLVNSKPATLYASALDTSLNLNDTIVINIGFKNGSIASICYFANGSKSLHKEYLEVYSNGITSVLDDFRKLTIYNSKKTVFKSGQDKGHAREVIEFLNAVKEGTKAPISFDDIYWSTKMTFDIIKSINNRKIITY